jgi:hypothetical protein
MFHENFLFDCRAEDSGILGGVNCFEREGEREREREMASSLEG